MSMTSQNQDQGKKTCHTASDSMISGEMDKIWILHSILCDEIRKWEAFSATPPVRLGVGQNDAQKCQGTNNKLQDDLIPQTKIFSCSIQKNWNQGTKDQCIITKLDLRIEKRDDVMIGIIYSC